MSDTTHQAPDLSGLGTPEARWRAAARLDDLPSGPVPAAAASGRVVVVAPHPDDEILGAGGLMAVLAAGGASVTLVAVTDGEMSDPARAEWLRAERPGESAAAAATLGVRYEEVRRLGHPDGGIDAGALGAALDSVIGRGDLVVGPWWRDGHPDHDLVGACCVEAAHRREAALACYLVWAWHWAAPEGDDVPWAEAVRVELPADVAARKAAAARCFASQLEGPEPILPDHVLERLRRPFEVFVVP